MQWLRRRLGGAPGQGLTEFALMTPVVLFLILGVIDVSRLMMTYIMLTNAARQGARYSVVNAGPSLYPCTYNSGDPHDLTHCSTIITSALRIAPTLDAHAIATFTMAYAYFGTQDGSGGTLQSSVTMTYTFQPLTLMILGNHTITLSANATYLQQ